MRNEAAPQTPIWNPLIDRVERELHARIAEPVSAPCRVRHSAYLLPDEEAGTRDLVLAGFKEVLQRLEIIQRNINWGERSGRVEVALPQGSTLRIVWELHTQFYSYTTFHFPAPATPAAMEEHLDAIPPFSFPYMPAIGDKIVDLDIAVLSGLELRPELKAFIGPEPIYGGKVLAGQARVWTNFKMDEQGQVRYLIRAEGLGAGRLGRLIRRLLEIENYYHLVLLPLDEYHEQVLNLSKLEHHISGRAMEIAAALAAGISNHEQERDWLVFLTQDLAELMKLTEKMRYKLSAANSYYAIFRERLRWVREQTGDSYQSMEEFLTGRIGPAHRNYENFIKRADVLASRITQLGNMMRTRVTLNMEGQSLETMKAMKARVELQLLMQRTVEGLSLVILTYYAASLFKIVLNALEKLWPIPGGTALWMAGSLPVWALTAFWITRRVHKLIKREVR